MHKQRLLASVFDDKRFPYFLLFAIGFLVYLNSFFNYFLWDDELLILNNGYIRSWANAFKIFLVDIYQWTNKSNFYRPIFSLSLLLDYSIWQLNPFGYHLTNFLLHLFNAFLVFYLIRFFSSNIRVPLITSLLFLVHPVHTEAVTYISGRADPLASVFILLSLLFFIKYLSQKTTKSRHYYFYSVIFFVCALLSKEIAIILPLFLILYDFIFFPPPKPSVFLVNLRKHIVFLGVALTYIILRMNFLPFSSEGRVPYDLAARIICLPKVFAFYLYILILPFQLRVERFFPLSARLDLALFASVLLLTLICFWLVKVYRRWKTGFFFFLWFLINLLVVTNAIVALNAVVAEHWLYLPSIGFFYIVATGIEKLLRTDISLAEWQLSGKFKRTIFIIIISTLALLTIARNFQWRNAVTIFQSTLLSSAGSDSIRDTRVRYNLACAYAQKGLLDKAISEYKRVLILRPDLEKVHYGLGLAYAQKGLDQEAEQQLSEAIRLDPDYLRPHYILGLIYLKQQEWYKAGLIWDKILAIKSTFPQDKQLQEKVILLREKTKAKLLEAEPPN